MSKFHGIVEDPCFWSTVDGMFIGIGQFLEDALAEVPLVLKGEMGLEDHSFPPTMQIMGVGDPL